MAVKEHLHQRIEAMSDEEAAEALRLLDTRGEDPVARLLDTAPLDDEPEYQEERRAVADALADPTPRAAHADVLRELGPTRRPPAPHHSRPRASARPRVRALNAVTAVLRLAAPRASPAA